MGIATGTFQQLLQEHRLRPLHGSLLTLGRQDIYLTTRDVRFWMHYYGIAPAPVPMPTLAAKPYFASHHYIDDRTLFSYFGASCESLDVSSYEGCDHVGDLNDAQPPESLRGRFDVVLDTGTFEHVFHLPNAFRFCHALLRDGGRMVHMSPASNYVDHGFYMLSPALFHDFYEANGWTLRQIRLIRHTREHDTASYWSLDYSPAHFAHLRFGGLGDGLYQTFVVAEKSPAATAHVVPRQRTYGDDDWRAADPGDAVISDEAVRERVRERLQQFAGLIEALRVAHGGALDVVIFGGGRHTRTLLAAWRDLGLAAPRGIMQSTRPTVAESDGLPVTTVEQVAAERTPHLIVLSSHAYEAEMAETAARLFPVVPLLRFWT